MDRPEQLSTGQQVNKETLLQQYLIIGKETLGLTVTQPYSGKPCCLMSHGKTGILWKEFWSQNWIYTVAFLLCCECILLEVKIIINVQIFYLFFHLSCVWISQGKWKRHTSCTAGNKTAQLTPALGYGNISQIVGSPQSNTPTIVLCLLLTYH